MCSGANKKGLKITWCTGLKLILLINTTQLRSGYYNSHFVVLNIFNNDNDFMRRTFSNLGKALLPGFIDLVAERRGDASYESSNYFLAVSLYVYHGQQLSFYLNSFLIVKHMLSASFYHTT